MNKVDESAASEEFLTFRLGAEEYGIDILKVREIRTQDKVTSIAGTPNFLKGVINLRGNIVPIVDLRIKLGLSDCTVDDQTVVIILNVAPQVVGIVVDSVSEVVALALGEIKAAPLLGGQVESRYVRGIGTVEDRMLILVDIEELVSGGDSVLMEAALA
jgi:purine-binding chemotaxis protein CheW